MTLIHTLLSTTMLAETPPAGGLMGSQWIPFVLVAVMIYFVAIRPQQRQRKEQVARIAALQNGDKVVTSAGIHGIVHNVKEHTVMVKVAEGTMIEFDKFAIAHVHKKETPAAK